MQTQRTVVIPGVGQFVAEEAPEEMLAALTAFRPRTPTDPPRQRIPGRTLPLRSGRGRASGPATSAHALARRSDRVAQLGAARSRRAERAG
jgi:hypothetical protein